MDEYGLPVVGAGIDYTKVCSLPKKELLALVNTFVVQSVHFLNGFAKHSEASLASMSTKIQQLEISLNILEAKLSHIPNLEGITGVEYHPPEPIGQLLLDVFSLLES